MNIVDPNVFVFRFLPFVSVRFTCQHLAYVRPLMSEASCTLPLPLVM